MCPRHCDSIPEYYYLMDYGVLHTPYRSIQSTNGQIQFGIPQGQPSSSQRVYSVEISLRSTLQRHSINLWCTNDAKVALVLREPYGNA